MSGFNFIASCVFAAVVVLFFSNSVAKYYIKFALFLIGSLIFSVIPIPWMIFHPFDTKNALIPSRLLLIAGYFLGFRCKIRGLQNIDDGRGSVVLINHQSGVDLIVLAKLWTCLDRCTMIAKRSVQYLVPFGTAAWLWGTVFIDRGSKSSRLALSQQANAIKDQKRKLLLFPEGTRNEGAKLLPFRKGAFHVALEAGAPIQPVVVSRYHFLDSKKCYFGSGEVIISILPAIETSNLMKDDLTSLIEKVQLIMQEEYNRISEEASSMHYKAD